MPDPITTANPAANAHLAVNHSAPATSSGRPLTVAQAHAEISKRCRSLNLSQSTTKALLKSLKVDTNSPAVAARPVQQGLQMLETVQKAVKHNPKLSSMKRDQYVGLFTTLGRRSGARQAWIGLGQEKQFWSRMSAKHCRTAAQVLVKNAHPPAQNAKGIVRVIKHHLFASANHVGRHNALADPCDSCTLFNASTLPDAATQKKQAARLMKLHLRHMKPASRAIMHRQVLAKANYLRKAFFEFKPGSKSKKLWGDRFVNAYGRDWYKQCLSMIKAHSERNACRSAYKMTGTSKGADAVCGKD